MSRGSAPWARPLPGAALLALPLTLLLLGGAVPAAAGSRGDDPDAPRLVVVGAPGLAWSDLERDDLPALGRLADEGAVGSLSVRSVRTRSCAVDGWLTLGAGRRAADLPGPCRPPAPVGADGVVPRWPDYRRAAADDSYGARPGSLADRAREAGACVETVGPGAAIAGAGGDGVAANHHVTLPSTFSCPVVLVDGGVLAAEGSDRAAAVRALDSTVLAVRSVDPGADLVVAGTGDGDSPVRLRALVASGPGYGAGVLTSSSTTQPGLAQLQDVTATALARVAASTDGLTGRPLAVEESRAAGTDRVAGRLAVETRAATMRAVSPQVTGWLAAAYVMWALLVAVLWWRHRPGSDDVLPRWLTVAGVVVAVTPVSTFVANLAPWWRVRMPGAAFVGVLAAVVVGLTALALRVGGRRPLGALRLVSAVTLVVLAADVLTGSRLQLASVFGANPVVGGRFYGFGNTSFALYGLAVLVLVGWVAGAGPSRRASAVRALGLLAVALAIDALPTIGADFGGPPGLLLGGLLVLASAAGVRVTFGRALLATVVAGTLATLVAWLDWLRPAGARTHLGDFVETVLSGDGGEVLGRKVAQNLANLTSPPLVAIALATVVLALAARRSGWTPVAAGRVVLPGALVMAAVGFAVNDSGLVIPAFVAIVLAPLLVAASPEPRVAGGSR